MLLLPVCTIRSESDNAVCAASHTSYAAAGPLFVQTSAESLLYDISVLSITARNPWQGL